MNKLKFCYTLGASAIALVAGTYCLSISSNLRDQHLQSRKNAGASRSYFKAKEDLAEIIYKSKRCEEILEKRAQELVDSGLAYIVRGHCRKLQFEKEALEQKITNMKIDEEVQSAIVKNKTLVHDYNFFLFTSIAFIFLSVFGMQKSYQAAREK